MCPVPCSISQLCFVGEVFPASVVSTAKQRTRSVCCPWRVPPSGGSACINTNVGPCIFHTKAGGCEYRGPCGYQHMGGHKKTKEKKHKKKVGAGQQVIGLSSQGAMGFTQGSKALVGE